ncbi:hypothetical protein [Selenomonas sp. FC4001]|uniref:hypothetical protein n=1 Tax=Selenomonas sp. FC4001 TaxID=1408313 RepID=UPI00055EA2D2|nr:hypothetical protein [Selenomonas sp. FC4001]
MNLDRFHKKGKYRSDWLQGFDAPEVEKPDYAAELRLSDAEIQYKTQKYVEHCDELEKIFQEKTSLTAVDLGFLMVAACLQTLRWAMVNNAVGRVDNAKQGEKFVEGMKDYFPASVEQLIMDHQVPYDMVKRSDRFIKIYDGESTGLSGANHRVKALGHDPLAGLLFGTANIATNTLSVNDWSQLFPSYHVRNGEIDGKTDIYHILEWSGNLLADKPEVVGASFIKQIIHCGTDVFTKQGLPVPIINTISPEISRFLVGNQIDFYSVTRGAMLAILINKIIEMCHRLFFNPNEDKRLYEVRTRKIILYSNTLSSVLNIGVVGLTKNIKYLDVGGLMVTLWLFLNDRKKIQEIRRQFIRKTIEGELAKKEEKARERLARLGVDVESL